MLVISFCVTFTVLAVIVMIDFEFLAETVKQHRKAAGLSQRQLAELSGVGKTVVFDIEKGKTTIKLETLNKVLFALNIQIRLASPLINQGEDNETS